MNNKIIPILIISAIVIGFIGWILPKTDLFGVNTSATNSTWSAYSYRVGTRSSNTEVISSSRGASFTTGSFSSTLGVTGATTLSDALTVDSVSYGSTKSYTFTTTYASTAAAADLCDYGTLNFTVSTTTFTLTLPTATSVVADCLSAAPEGREVLIRNLSTAGSSTALTAGSGFTFVYPNASSTATIIGGRNVLLKMIASSTTNIIGIITTLSE